MATPTTTQRKAAATKRSTTAKRAAGTRARNSAKSTARTQARRTTRTAQRNVKSTANTAEREAQGTLDQVEDIVEKAALTYVGAVLTARDRVAQGIEYVGKTYGDTTSVQRQLKKFERRGNTGVNRAERQIKKTRTRVER